MDKVFKVIEKNKMFKTGEVIGIAVSGGIDSMCLLHFLASNKEKYDIDIVAITVDHCIRENSANDTMFVMDYCRQNHIRCHRFRVDALKIAKDKNIGIEQAAREARYGVFDALIKKGIIDKIALAHHISDQAETILMHILRGAGLSGASGMEYIRGVYVRPFLDLTKDDITKYAYQNDIPNVEDETNADSSYTRNFIRNEIMPKLRKRFPSVDQNIVSFGKACKQDDDYIMSQAPIDGVWIEDKTAKIPLNYFVYPSSVVARIIFYALNKIGLSVDIEKKHINMIKSLADSANGKKINLPNNGIAIKEYEYITIISNKKEVVASKYPFEIGKIDFAGIYDISVKRTKILDIVPGRQLIDLKKISKDAIWRTREKGDMFEKFGGGSKPLRTYLIDKKVPSRLRDTLPVLADGKEILVILGVEISNKVKVDKTTKQVCSITYTTTKK